MSNEQTMALIKRKYRLKKGKYGIE